MDESDDIATMTSKDATQATRPPSCASITPDTPSVKERQNEEGALVVYHGAPHAAISPSATLSCDYVGPRLEEQERVALRAEAQREYNGRLLRVMLLDLQREERNARGEIADSAAFTFEALRQWLRETCAQDPTTTTAAEALARLLRLLQRRAASDAASAAAREQRLCEEGRAAWRAEVAAQEAARRRQKAEELRRRTEHDRLCRALTFISVQEKRARAELQETAMQAYHSVAVHEVAERELARQRALENFMMSPEQMALAAEQERQQAKERKRIAREARLHRAQQERFVNNCHHGRGGNSLFAGPAPQKVCGKCRVRFDDALGYYVSMDEPKANTATSGTGARRSTVSTAEGRPKLNSILTTTSSSPAAAATVAAAKGRKRSSAAVPSAKQPTAPVDKKKVSNATSTTLPALAKPAEAAATHEATEDTSTAAPVGEAKEKKVSAARTRSTAHKAPTGSLPAIRTKAKQ